MTSSNGNILRFTDHSCIDRSQVNSPHKGQWQGALIFLLICAWINGWVNNGKAGDLRRHRAHYDITVMVIQQCSHRSNVPRTTLWSVQNFMQMQNQFTSHCLRVIISLSILMECVICNTNLNITVIRYISVIPLYIHDRLQALSKFVRF